MVCRHLPVVDEAIKGVARFFIFPAAGLVRTRRSRLQHQQRQDPVPIGVGVFQLTQPNVSVLT